LYVILSSWKQNCSLYVILSPWKENYWKKICSLCGNLLYLTGNRAVACLVFYPPETEFQLVWYSLPLGTELQLVCYSISLRTELKLVWYPIPLETDLQLVWHSTVSYLKQSRNLAGILSPLETELQLVWHSM
jgi:hypothetical protein